MADLPIVCTLGPAALRARRESLLTGLVGQAGTGEFLSALVAE